jgi:hypothetical protein
LAHETMVLPPRSSWRASPRTMALSFPLWDRRLSHRNLPRLQNGTQRHSSRSLPFGDSPSLGAVLTTRPHYYGSPDCSWCVGSTLRLRLIASLAPPALRPRGHEHHRRHHEPSPGQTLLCPSVLSAHTVSRTALRRYFLRCKAASSDQRGHGRPVRPGSRLGYGPEVRRRPFGFHLAVDTLPSAPWRRDGRRVLARPLVYASPLRGCGGTFTRKRSALLGAQP